MDGLPVEIIHRIFDHLEASTILFSIQVLSRSFRSMVNSYNRFSLNFKKLSQQHFRLLCRLLSPQQIISLTFANEFDESNEIYLFLSSILRLQSFTRLQNLTLEQIDEYQLQFLLKRLNLASIRSFTVSIRKYDKQLVRITESLLTSIFIQPTLRQLNLSLKERHIFYVNCKLISTIRRLLICNYNIIDNLHEIFLCCPHLHTVVLKYWHHRGHLGRISGYKLRSTFQQIRSLSIENFRATIDTIESLLSLVPSLNYLKLVGRSEDCIVDGSRWEHLLQTSLPQLNKFEFFFHQYSNHNKTLDELNYIHAAFQTPFWIDHKQWFTIFGYTTASKTDIRIYTIPICTSAFTYDLQWTQFPSPTLTAMTMKNDTVKEITVELREYNDRGIEKKETMKNYFHFDKVTCLTLNLSSQEHILLLASIFVTIDITNIMQMTISGFSMPPDALLKLLNFCFEKAHNLRSLAIGDFSYESDSDIPFEGICSILPRQLQHLDINIVDIEQIKMLLERCKNLLTLKLGVRLHMIAGIKQWFDDNTINSMYSDGYYLVFVWLGKMNIECTKNEMVKKRMKIDSSS
ncbi:unnamed protein product [Adineta ricciae]|uniref:F-box domain-containing protein n=1 Tax=Adineta ricciae TaxID=249248 RepID=A0A813UND9_ADIRI|nr:unnamed protein product [Adineta ricciae]CAF1457050.1 unnamed protein product [Adineta ricciae]